MSDIIETYEKLSEHYLPLVKKYVEIDETEVNKTMLEHSALYAFFGAVLAYAKKVQDMLSTKLDMSEAKHKELRRVELTGKGQKVTESHLNTYVLVVPELIDMRAEVIEAQQKYNLAKNILSSMDHQKDMLVQLSANKRAEVKLISE
jgi:hypothetical protein